jgi:hypothetical protein
MCMDWAGPCQPVRGRVEWAACMCACDLSLHLAISLIALCEQRAACSTYSWPHTVAVQQSQYASMLLHTVGHTLMIGCGR